METPMGVDGNGSGGKMILLVDDEGPILEFGKEILGFYGFETITAQDGHEAIELFNSKRELIGLVILDLSMPTMDGSECLKKMLEIDPNAKIFMSSGYSSKGQVQEMLNMGASGFLMKPFRFDAIVEQVNAAMGKGA